ncbi:MAG: hypothetical protein A2825_03715 [Candidatus Taylorbacteria bacterium RIFCSPHIGHO2_01_FULL_43_120]|nr:MAG: hypothetical protein A2825_03715 [Candidatus Taylorbacteria bacterium RIFCSPHIGHO2_01_FULL_43_120]OHA22055.1 MAG: hypothetical protein A3B98_04100 [Candidatus Taylorbacteria bacterium RIFCSPHIGHO2_02_FULL_43_55]OHA30366.1 MAG: hypothetical protein A3E92_00675 [Candidatus Taylorbacteria bacterium RIFCSPHIGHO2_12_FULL_42_34]OHA31028.1 MAG: hypothetical protein A3B09_04045 [Candidatus Taylorbacteria bacterium RIFCSPLOWO2_01_FULL_43_83]OHA39736.1 MAG: hypothetical protein A3H58_04755 [Candi
MPYKADWNKYVISFVITSFIFFTAIVLSWHFNNRRLVNVRAIEDKISIDILSSETQFSLLAESSCKDVNTTFLFQELNSLAEKIEYSEQNLRGSEEIISLKKYYSLLQIKDYLLMKKVSERCQLDPIFIIYFYSNKDNCPDCARQGYVLTSLRDKHPELRVYSFDYLLDLSALRALISIYKVPDTLPALVLDEKTYTGFKSIEEIEKIIPELAEKATSTPAVSENEKPATKVRR